MLRSRPNLHIASEAFVRRIEMEHPGPDSPPGSLPRASAIELDLNSGERILVHADKEVRLLTSEQGDVEIEMITRHQIIIN